MDKREFIEKVGNVYFDDVSDEDYYECNQLYNHLNYNQDQDAKQRIADLYRLGGIETVRNLLKYFGNKEAGYYQYNRDMLDMKIDELLETESIINKYKKKCKKAEKIFIEKEVKPNNPSEKDIEVWSKKCLIRL